MKGIARVIIVLLTLVWSGCQSAFYQGKAGEYVVVVDKTVPEEPGARTIYTVQNITRQSKFLSGGRYFTINSPHIFHIGDTVQMYTMESPKDN